MLKTDEWRIVGIYIIYDLFDQVVRVHQMIMIYVRDGWIEF